MKTINFLDFAVDFPGVAVDFLSSSVAAVWRILKTSVAAVWRVRGAKSMENVGYFEKRKAKTLETSNEMHLGRAKCEPQALREIQNVCGCSLARPRCDWFGVFHYFTYNRSQLGNFRVSKSMVFLMKNQ